MTVIRHFVIYGVAIAGLLSMAAAPTSASSLTLFWDQMNDGTNWGVNGSAGGDWAYTFGYNYSADGIPEAPNSQGGDVATTGVKLEANMVTPAAGEFFTLYPIGENFTGQYRLSFDAWANYDVQELLEGDAVGTTEFLGGGIGYDGVTADIASGAQAIATGDGGSSNDYRVFKSPPQFFIPDAAMAGGNHNASIPYYTNFLPGQVPPAAQGQAALAGPDGTTGFQWLTWHFSAQNQGGSSIVRIDLEKPNGDIRRLALVDCNDTSDGSNGCTAEGNISLFYADFFSSVSPRRIWTFGVVDNVHVRRIPEPSAFVLLALGSIALVIGRRRR